MPFLANITGRKIQFVQGNDVDTYPPELAVECYKARTDKRWETMAVSRYALNWTGREGEIIPNFVEEGFYPKETYKDIDVLIEGNLEENKGVEEALEITEGMNRAWLGRTTKPIPNCKMFTNPKREEIPDIFRRSKITLKCSKSEGFGLPHLEAMATGSCLVTYNSGGNDFCVDRENCRVVDKGTARGCIERMTRERRQQLINGGLETASKYRLPNSMAKLLKFLRL
jgi:glycosyltransferase involved in cell wall biosynthesis